MITCKECGEIVEAIEWAAHKAQHGRAPMQSSMQFKTTNRLQKAASKFVDTMQKLGGGSIEVTHQGVRREFVTIPPKE